MQQNGIIDLIYKMLRWRTTALLLLFIAISDITTAKSGAEYNPKLLVAAAIIACWYVFSTSVNDLSDEAIDKINLKGNKERPLANNEIGRTRLVQLAIVSAVAAGILAVVISPWAVQLTAAALGLSYIYSYPPIRLSGRGIFAPLCLPIGYILFPMILVMIVNNARISNAYLLLLAGLYVSFAGRIILKDFRDVVGDKKFGKRTFIVRHGAVATCWVSAVAWLIGDLIICYRFKNWPVFMVLTQLFVVVILTTLFRLAHEPKTPRQVQMVGLIGRLGNGTALLVLALLYNEFNHTSANLTHLLLVSLAAFYAYAAYVLYRPLFHKSLTG